MYGVVNVGNPHKSELYILFIVGIVVVYGLILTLYLLVVLFLAFLRAFNSSYLDFILFYNLIASKAV